jgi:hypothetical protein
MWTSDRHTCTRALTRTQRTPLARDERTAGSDPVRPANPYADNADLKMTQGGTVAGGTLFSATDPSTYCAIANAGYDFVWTEMQHDQRDWETVARMWRTCPHAKAVPGVRVA